MRTPSERQLMGRRIVGFDAGTWVAGDRDRTRMHDPTIKLDDGSFLRFMAEENPSGGEYGVMVLRSLPRKQP